LLDCLTDGQKKELEDLILSKPSMVILLIAFDIAKTQGQAGSPGFQIS
jgi:hypothetical protein